MDCDVEQQIIDCGGVYAIASLFAIRPQSVVSWKKTKVPKSRLAALSLLFPEQFSGYFPSQVENNEVLATVLIALGITSESMTEYLSRVQRKKVNPQYLERFKEIYASVSFVNSHPVSREASK